MFGVKRFVSSARSLTLTERIRHGDWRAQKKLNGGLPRFYRTCFHAAAESKIQADGMGTSSLERQRFLFNAIFVDFEVFLLSDVTELLSESVTRH